MYKPGIYHNFDELVKINNHLFPHVIDYNVRDNECIKSIEDKLDFLNKLKELNEEYLLNAIASILCMQPFYDGNSRALKIYMYNYLIRFEKELYLNDNNTLIPIFYTENDTCSDKDIVKFKSHIK